ncbi:MAG: hypothetical protein WC614_01555 [bacterium]
MPTAISLNYKLEDFPNGEMTIDDDINVFEDRVNGWQIDIAKQCGSIPNAGFGVLHIILSYFESIAKFREGYVNNRASMKYFKLGIMKAIPQLSKLSSTKSNDVVNTLYSEMRCALYHAGMTGRGILITQDINEAISIESRCIYINPANLVEAAQQDFDMYIKELRDPKNIQLRTNFRKRFKIS